MFETEPEPPITEEQMRHLDETFKQKPISLKIPIPQVTEKIVIEKQETNYLPYILLGLFGLFAFLGFLAFLKKRD
jgi:hypothetical protein